MAKSKTPTPEDVVLPQADPTSDAVVLRFTGHGRAGAPERDLTAADLARLAYTEAARRTLADGTRPDPRKPDPEIAAAIARRLVASGAYSIDLADPDAEPAATTTPEG